MPLFYIEVTIDGRTSPLNEGLQLDSLHDAWAEATSACGALLRDIDGALASDTEIKVAVLNEDCRTLRSITVTTRSH